MKIFEPLLGDYLVFKNDQLLAFWDQRESITFFDCESASKIGSTVVAESYSERLDPLDSSTEEWELASDEAYDVASAWAEKFQHENEVTRDAPSASQVINSVFRVVGSLFTSKGSKPEELPFIGQVKVSATRRDFIVDVTDDAFTAWNPNNPDRFRVFRTSDFSHAYNFGESQGWDPEYFLIASDFAQNWRENLEDLVAEDLASSDP